ncbi:transposase (ISH5) [Natrialba taiwanensis DSM 12281]|uniref:Transposase (ISH5) n=1 Tax=Natrialba taiwanensis DSM 12281 TaxID=1230458 RepID=M0A557_9EURY|nr:transposase (ISH5) [Natrialba taiwanensis DSM 12281]
MRRLVGVRNDDSGEYHLYLTNLDRDDYRAPDIAQLYRARWEIELLFKELKSRFGRDQHDRRLHHRGADHHGGTLVADEPGYRRRTPETRRNPARLRRRRRGVVDAAPSTTMFTRCRTARASDPVVPDAGSGVRATGSRLVVAVVVTRSKSTPSAVT